MTTYMLTLAGDEERAADATHWVRSRKARLLSISRPSRATAPPGMPGKEGLPVMARGPAAQFEDRRGPVTRDPAALAALLLRTLDLQDGAGVVLADFDSEEFAADVLARIAALGRRVTAPGKSPRFAFGALLRAHAARNF